MTTILRLDTSARHTGSVSRQLTDRIVSRFGDAKVVTRDLAQPLPLLDENWVYANFTPAADRTDAQRETLALSDTLVAELKEADVLVIGLPIYNFGAPAAFKAWVDLVARVGLTFQYSEAGPEGLLSGKRAIVAYASGGVPMGSPVDFASGHVRQVLAFLGITDVEFVAAEGLNAGAENAVEAAEAAIDALNLAA
ncbi:FMN-dependent NADH-azoreductase [Actibacterium ureilyticum]|uniref:FMN-dependent NADH-azoreductase n=1 Tax=Actibacterium ureilyticum TaxID=1590614 RepID=UPI000BAA980C|nr:NAD(P)H-dependent oxidoreductase [Actibacterium ureilyticum]